MRDCNHEHSSKKEISREIGGESFHAHAQVCTECGAELWTNDLRKKFNKWVSALTSKPRIQFRMSHSAEKCLDQFLLEFPGANKTVFVRAMIAVYLNLLSNGPKTNEIFNQIFDSDYYVSFDSDNEKRNFPTDVKAYFYFDIQSWGKAFGVSPNQMAYEAFHLMMALYISEDEKLRTFWKSQIQPQLETIIKAA